MNRREFLKSVLVCSIVPGLASLKPEHAKFDPHKQYGDYLVFTEQPTSYDLAQAKAVLDRSIKELIPKKYRGDIVFLRGEPHQHPSDHLSYRETIGWKYKQEAA